MKIRNAAEFALFHFRLTFRFRYVCELFALPDAWSSKSVSYSREISVFSLDIRIRSWRDIQRAALWVVARLRTEPRGVGDV